ncbi:hypothetical protein [Sulfurimonas sp.]
MWLFGTYPLEWAESDRDVLAVGTKPIPKSMGLISLQFYAL